VLQESYNIKIKHTKHNQTYWKSSYASQVTKQSLSASQAIGWIPLDKARTAYLRGGGVDDIMELL
jgi:hypothetical protein